MTLPAQVWRQMSYKKMFKLLPLFFLDSHLLSCKVGNAKMNYKRAAHDKYKITNTNTNLSVNINSEFKLKSRGVQKNGL
jgi:hypothetical protein